MSGKQNIENSTMTSFTHRRSLLVPVIALAAACLFAGCPEQAHVKVTIKPDAAAGAGTSAETAAEPTVAAGYGNLTGRITLDGEVKELPLLVTVGEIKEEDKAVCAAQPILNSPLSSVTAAYGWSIGK